MEVKNSILYKAQEGKEKIKCNNFYNKLLVLMIYLKKSLKKANIKKLLKKN
jgi:hypothetical protein